MDQTAIGSYIMQKRRALNLTQEQLAEELGVSNKTVSKWEESACRITVSFRSSARRFM